MVLVCALVVFCPLLATADQTPLQTITEELRAQLLDAKQGLELARSQAGQFERTMREALEARNKTEREAERRVAALMDEKDKVESEKIKLADDLGGAAAHVRLATHQKSAMTQELEKMYKMLSDTEQQLANLRAENAQLRARAGASASTTPSTVSASAVPLPTATSSAIGAEQTTVRVKRSGSILISRPGAAGEGMTMRTQASARKPTSPTRPTRKSPPISTAPLPASQTPAEKREAAHRTADEMLREMRKSFHPMSSTATLPSYGRSTAKARSPAPRSVSSRRTPQPASNVSTRLYSMPTKSSSKKARSRLHVRRSGSVTVTQGVGGGGGGGGGGGSGGGAGGVATAGAADVKGAKARVHVHRSGSISVSQFARGGAAREAAAAAAAAATVSTQRATPITAGGGAEHAHGDAHEHGDAPWMIGVDTARSSERR